VIEHFEPEVSRWTLSEYAHMILILSNLYNDSTFTESRLILTNFSFPGDLNLGKLSEDEYGSLKHT
jgi:hypothetical protein